MPFQVECLLVPDVLVLKGGREHSRVSHNYYANNESKILRHLEHWHPNTGSELEKALSEARIESLILEKVRIYESTKIAQPRPEAQSSQQTIVDYLNLHRQLKIRVFQALIILRCGHSFRSLETPLWNDMFQAAGLDSQTGLSRSMFKRIYFPAFHYVIAERQKMVFSAASQASITTDCWSDKKMRTYLGVTIHWVTRDFQLNCALLDLFPLTDSHTSEYLTATLTQAVNAVCDNSVLIHCATGDGAANSKSSLRDYVGYKVCYSSIFTDFCVF